MTLRLHLQMVGALLILLGFAHAFFSRYFGWPKELSAVSLLTRQIFFVHCFFIALVVVMMGACSLFYTDALLAPGGLSRVIVGGIVVFWLCRLAIQFLVYDAAIWKGRRFYTWGHVAFTLLWTYVVATYGITLRRLWQ